MTLPYRILLWTAVIVAGLFFTGIGEGIFRACRRALVFLGRRRIVALLVVGGFSLALTLSMLVLEGVPRARVHDEFSFLLAGDTFAHGRLANPPHPLWEHFESFHILQQPTYASKYPPGQGFILAAGQVLTGYPIAGVILSLCLACIAATWMLQAYLPSRWALAGGLLLCLHPVIWLLSGCTYWGIALPLAGGSLVLGGLGRLLDHPHFRAGLLLAGGMALLAITRPYEGLILSALAGLVLLHHSVWAKRLPLTQLAHCYLLPGVLIMTPTLLFMGYYNWRVTGHATQMPYVLYESQYGITPLFAWQDPPAVHRDYRHEELRIFNEEYAPSRYVLMRTPWGFIHEVGSTFYEKIFTKGYFRLPGLALFLLPLPWVIWRNRRMRLAALICLICLFFTTISSWAGVRYTAPVAGLLFLLFIQGMRVMGTWRWKNRRLGRIPVRAALLALLLTAPVLAVDWAHLPQDGSNAGLVRRDRLLKKLNRLPGEHVVLVRYLPDHIMHEAWIQNSADIDHQKVIWAWDMSPAENQKLFTYYPDRHIWLLEVGADSENEPVPYPQLNRQQSP